MINYIVTILYSPHTTHIHPPTDTGAEKECNGGGGGGEEEKKGL